MKNVLFIIVTGFVSLVHSGKMNNHQFFPNLPIGEYQVKIISFLKCNNVTNDEIQHNFYLNKYSSTEIELRGNITYKIPLDDSLTVHVNMAIKDSIGGWKDNAHLISAPKACTAMKMSLGPIWGQFMKSFGNYNLNCPVNPGVYVSKGFKLTDSHLTTNLPKRFFYGTYKLRSYFTDNRKNVYGCTIFVIEIKRPWDAL